MNELISIIYSLRDLLLNHSIEWKKFGIAIILTVSLVFLLWILNQLFRWITRKILSLRSHFLKPIRIKNTVLVSRQNISFSIRFFLDISKLVVIIYGCNAFFSQLFALFPWAESAFFVDLFVGIFVFILLTRIIGALYKGFNNIFALLSNALPVWINKLPKSYRFKDFEILQPERIEYITLVLIRIFRISTLSLLLVIYVTIGLGLFPWTKGWSEILLENLFSPIKKVGLSVLNYTPNLIFLIVLIGIGYFISSFLKYFFIEVEKGKIKLNGFNKEWSDTTYKLIRFLLIVFTAIVGFPYLPGANSEAFKGISIFLGILFSLGSTSIISNIVSGVVLTYMLPFKLGDRVKIGDTVGDVLEKNLLVTRIRTTKNVIVTIPNSSILSNQIINYSSQAIRDDVILHTTISLGYDIPWKKVHKVLIAAAIKSEHVLKDPSPFVLQTKLDDFYIVYELNAYTNQPHKQASIYSSLHENIQDECTKAGIEILSPHYRAHRNGE